LRKESKSYARRGLTRWEFSPGNNVYDSEVNRASNTLELRSNLIVLRSREEVDKEGIEWSIILAFVGSRLVDEFELKSDEFKPRHILNY
jgi:hypothetical protein